MQSVPEALAPMAQYKQWINWKLVQFAGEEKPRKVPTDPKTGRAHSAQDPAIWQDAEMALFNAQQTGLNVGFVFTDKDPFFFLDIDGALNPDGTWNQIATDMCARFAGCAVELSQSGAGLHIFGTGLTPAEFGTANKELGLEFYTTKRFVALTGTHASGSALYDATAALSQVVPTYFPPKAGRSGEDIDWDSGPCEGWTGPSDDDELIRRMLRSKSDATIFNGRAGFADLWDVNEVVLAVTYPDPERAFDHSKADAALMQHLSFWTGKDPARMKRLFERSGLVRDKWHDREEYQHWTVDHAVSVCSSVYQGKGDKPEIPTEPLNPRPVMTHAPGITQRKGYQLMLDSDQREHFAGCVYVRDLHRAFVPDGALLKPEQFRAVYGGYVFALDSMNDKTTRNAWEVFTESQVLDFPTAHRLCFRPEEKPGQILVEDGHTLMNTYVPVVTPSTPGDVARFTDHLAKILPVERDRDILLAYMAACVQYPGHKFRWAPLLQGVEGNGKTLLIKCLRAAIGARHFHAPNANDLSNKFNLWLFGKCFVGVEEVYVRDRVEVIEALKPMITNDEIEIQGKGSDQITMDNRANFLLCSNHKDAIRKTQNDRRYAVFYTAQQEKEDIARDGMGGSYFPSIYDWLKKDGGFAEVTNFLQTYEIPDELNPGGLCHEAPRTSSTEEAIAVSLGPLEQEILEAVEEGRWGFCGDFVSSMAIDRLISEKRLPKVPQRKRGAMMKTIGYEIHAQLPNGRIVAASMGDGGRARIYTKIGSEAALMQNPIEISSAYESAQTPEGVLK